MRLDEDPLDVALQIKRGFERTVASSERPKAVDPDYLRGVAVWWLVVFAAASIVGLGWLPAALCATLVCGFWPVVLLFDRTSKS
jgi:hypothetical protein